jgi:hypothetical protein
VDSTLYAVCYHQYTAGNEVLTYGLAEVVMALYAGPAGSGGAGSG